MVSRYPGGGTKARSLVTLVLVVAFFICRTPAHAATSGGVVMNEIMWDETEYIELFNTADSEVALGGWALTRQASGGEVKTIVTFADGDTIAPHDFYLIEKQETATEVAGNKLVSSLTLLNTGELLQLKDDAGAVIDQANQLGMWFAGINSDVGVAMERTTTPSDGTLLGSWHTATNTLAGRAGTPGAVNSAPPVNHVPVAVLTGPSNGLTNTALTFSAEDSSDEDDDKLTYAWTFGDGATGTGTSPTHTYSAVGTFTLRLTVTDGEAEAEATRSITISTPVYADTVVINEFLPDPVGSDTTNEFIELKNMGGSSVDLSGWQLDDAAGGSTPYTIPASTSIAGGGFKSFSRTETKIALNNSGDTVRLLDPAGVVRSTITYASTIPEGQSYNRTSTGSFAPSTTVTSGTDNVITVPVDEAEEDEDEAGVAPEKTTSTVSPTKSGRVAGSTIVTVPLADVREEELGTLIQTEGVVSVPPGVLGKQVLYLAGSGIQVYFSKSEFPALKLGDKVALTGELASARNEARLKVNAASDIKKVAAEPPPMPHHVATGEIDEDKEGWLVVIQGHVTKTSGDTFYVNDDSGEIKVFIAESTNIDKPKMKKGTAVTITGIVSETTGGYRILPRFQEDVRLGLVAGLTSFPATGKPLLPWADLAGLLLLALLLQPVFRVAR